MEHTELEALLARDLVISSRRHRRMRGLIARRVKAGTLVRLLPGVYAPARTADLWQVRVAAAAAAFAGATLVGASAFALAEGRAPSDGHVHIAHSWRPRNPPPWLHVTRAGVPESEVGEYRGVRTVTVAFAAVQLAGTDHGTAIDTCFRQRLTDLPQVEEALSVMPSGHGRRERRAVVAASRTLPWSQAERVCHRILRVAGITGWATNVEVQVDGVRQFLDVAFKTCRLALEIDGYEHHSSLGAFIADRERQNRLVLEGWRILRFTWHALMTNPDQVVRQVKAALRQGRPRRVRRLSPDVRVA